MNCFLLEPLYLKSLRDHAPVIFNYLPLKINSVMKRMQLLIIFLSLFLVSFNSNKNQIQQKDRKEWVSLFNGKNLDNWIPKIAGYKPGENFGNTFRVENSILSVRYDHYDNFKNKFGALYYNKKFTNYRLRVEYRFIGDTVAGAPSWGYRDGGIQYHCQSPASLDINQPFPICLEYNLLGGNGKEERPSGEICANGIYVEINGKRNSSYCTPPTVKKTMNGEEWVTAEIVVRDGKITHFINGEEVIHFENPKYDSSNTIAKKFIVAGDNVVKEGYISLQSNSNPVDFRKVEIREY